jgi:hypothetical protein
MVWNSSSFQLLIISAGGGFTGLFVYSPVPGHGNLIASIAAQVSTDPYGDTYQEGIVSYNPGASFVQLNDGGVIMKLTGGTPSVIPAAMQVALAGTGQSLQISSGTVGADGGSLLLLNDSAVSTGPFGPGLQVTDGADGNTYDTERITLVTTTTVPINSTANTVITGLSKPVAAGKYFFRGIFRSKQGIVDVVQKIGFQGPANNQCVWFYNQSNTTNTTLSEWTGVASLTTVGAGYGGASNTNYLEYWGTVNFTAAGTFSAVAAEGTAGDSFEIDPGSIMEIGPVRAS